MRTVCVFGNLPPKFWEGFCLLSEDLKLTADEKGFPVEMIRGDCLELEIREQGARLIYDKPVSCWRGLSLLAQHWGTNMHLRQKAAFQTLGVMLESSRNAVMKPETVRFMLRKIALMGFDLCMLYTEDTYEVPQYPYFGHLRGRYSQSELKALDDYAFTLGIEMCPCIQTLGHLNRALHWPRMSYLRDTGEILLVGQPETYAFLRDLLREATAPFRSRKIHVGMDEAFGLGTGVYSSLHGYTEPYAIMQEHLNHLMPILRELGLEPYMWSDMYFRLASPTHDYYNGAPIDRCVAEKAPKDMGLIYWDYYHNDEETYSRMLSGHLPFEAPLAFAGGIWTWLGPAPDFEKTRRASVPGLRQAKAHGVPMVLATTWGDNGAETNLLTALYGMQLYAEFDYTEEADKRMIDERFAHVAGADPAAFAGLTRFNQIPGLPGGTRMPMGAAKILLYQDPLIPIFEKDLEGADPAAHYAALAEEYAEIVRHAADPWNKLMCYYAELARALAIKCCYHALAGTAVRSGDRASADEAASLAEAAAERLQVLRSVWRDLWYSTNRLSGFEVIEIRVAGIAARMESAAALLRDYAEGRIDTIETLAEDPLPYAGDGDASLCSYSWGEIASACNLDG